MGLRHDDVIKWKYFPRYWPFVQRIHRSTLNSPHKRQSRGALIFSLLCAWIDNWVNNREIGDFGPDRALYAVIVMITYFSFTQFCTKHGSVIAALCAKFQNDWTTDTNVMDERDFVRFELTHWDKNKWKLFCRRQFKCILMKETFGILNHMSLQFDRRVQLTID